MTFEDWPRVVAEIPVDGTWELPLLITSEDGTAPDPAEWAGHAEFSANGITFATFDTDGTSSPDGSITLTAYDDVWTRVVLLLPSDFTRTLAPSNDLTTGANEQAGIGSFSIWRNDTPSQKWRVCDFWVRVYSE